MTTSKIKISGAGIFSGTLSTKANNGLVLYGRSTDGKSFLKKVDVDTVDLEFPNGTWNFYAVAWEQASPTSMFQGTTVCGKTENINLNGTDTTINLSLTNNNCADNAFSANTDYVGATSSYTLPNRHFISCRDLSIVGAYNDQGKCGRSSFNNRGYATYIKLFVPQYKDFGKGLEEYNTTLMQTACIKLNTSIDISEEQAAPPGGMIHPNQLHFPDPINGFRMGMRVYYTPTDTMGCDDASGVDEMILPMQDTPRSKTYFTKPGSISPVAHTYFQSNETQVCQGPRLGTQYFMFAGGAGNQFSPFVLCTPEQFNNIDTYYNHGTYYPKGASFELASDLNFNFGPINLIGNTVAGDPTSTADNWNGLLFEGNGHKMENIFVKVTAAANVIGIFRNAASAEIKNLTLNRIAIIAPNSTEVGGLVGESQTSSFRNIKVHGHVEGSGMVGGVVGKVTVSAYMNNVHSKIDLKAENGNGGGIIGYLSNTSGSSTIMQSSVNGEVRSNSNFVGGFIGGTSVATAMTVAIQQSVAKVDLIANSDIGGLVGGTSGAGTFSVVDSYVQGGIYSNGGTNAGGLLGTGAATTNSFSNIFAEVVKGGLTTTNFGGVFGGLTGGINCSGAVYYLKDGTNITNATCNDNTNNEVNNQSTLYSSLASAMLNANWTQFGASDIPRLTFEAGVSTTVPYLGQSDCDGHYTQATILGNGTQTTPYIICSAAQFANISAGNYYKMARTVSFGSNESSTPKAAGVYNIDGSGNGVYGYSLISNSTGDNGLFASLYTGSNISNLKIFKISTAAPNSATSDYTLGLIAGRNNGVIKDVRIIKSKIGMSGGAINISGAGSFGSVGGVVGINDTNGELNNVKTTTRVDFTKTVYGSISSQLYLGGVVGINNGTIKGSKFQDEFKMDPNYMNAIYEHYASLAAVNSGTIMSSTLSPSFYAYSSVSAGGALKLGIIAEVNNGNIYDMLVGGSINLTNVTGLTYGLLVTEPSAGSSLKRTIYIPSSTVGYYPSSSTGILPSSGIVSETFCIHTTTGCMTSTSGQFSFTSPNFSAGTFVSNSNDWNMADSSANSTTATWIFKDANTPPNLYEKEASLAGMGTGF